MKKYIYIFGMLTLSLAACKSTDEMVKETPQLQVLEAPKPTNTALLNSVLWHQQAAEYEALCHQAFNTAVAYLSSSKERGEDYDNKPPSIIIDIDNVILDNSPYYARLIKEGIEDNVNSWRDWVSQSNADLIPGAKNFIEFTKDLGAKIYFTSTRPEESSDMVINNLHMHGIDVNANNVYFSSVPGAVIEYRNEIMQKEYVDLLIGSKLSDFSTNYIDPAAPDQRKTQSSAMNSQYGQRFIILPNLLSGEWNLDILTNPNNLDRDLDLLKTK